MKLAPPSYVPAALAVGLLVWTVDAIYDSVSYRSATLSDAFFSRVSLVDILSRLALAALLGTAVVLYLQRKERHRRDRCASYGASILTVSSYLQMTHTVITI